jgi:hypothetical protein
MDDYFLSGRKRIGRFLDLARAKRRDRFKGVGTRKQNILVTIILALSTGLFFSVYFEGKVSAKQREIAKTVSEESVDPMNRIGKGTMKLASGETDNLCRETDKEKKFTEKEVEENKNGVIFSNVVKGHPMEAMVPYITKRDKKVAAFLIGIAKKESDWGTHSPKKSGRDCYNYWGFKGGYKPVAGGYSCFDNPEQAIAVVGDKIESLIEKKIDTPERMVVWKCGSNCAGHDPAGVRSWIGTVRGYWQSLNS